MNGREKIEALKETRPTIAVVVSRTIDHYESWDGDGPSPRDEGMNAYIYKVTAMAIRHGELVEADTYLSSCWYYPDDVSDTAKEIGGYLSQMVDEVIDELDKELAR